MQTSTETTTTTGNRGDAAYDEYLRSLQARYGNNTADHQPIFETDAKGLWETFLGAFPAERRQYHTCNECRSFIERYGHLVTIDPATGQAYPLFWCVSDTQPEEQASVRAVVRIVEKARVTGVFLSSEQRWGHGTWGANDNWVHLGILPRQEHIHRDRVKTAYQAAAEKKEDYGQVCRALAEFSAAHVETALTLLRSDDLYRSEKVLGQAEFLAKLHAVRGGTKNTRARENLTWLAVAEAPAGFCHPKSSMIGSLLEDIAAGKSYDAVAASFKAKMHPLQYQRPQAAPAAGAIEAAEKLFEKLGLAPALRRRFARMEDIEAFWRPIVPEEKPSEGVFGHLKPKGGWPKGDMMMLSNLPDQTMTWVKFRRDVLHAEAQRLELHAPSIGNYAALVTACDPAAPPILQWDRENRRNPVSAYVWHGGSPATQWGLTAGYVEVEALCAHPAHWKGGEYPQHREQVLLVLRGARESRQGGLALFPEILRGELHGVRSVIEAHSKQGKLEGLGEPMAAGLLFGDKSSPMRLRVTTATSTRVYLIDRWE